jgi:hypothetical protein
MQKATQRVTERREEFVLRFGEFRFHREHLRTWEGETAGKQSQSAVAAPLCRRTP